jgi:hypothetical protein
LRFVVRSIEGAREEFSYILAIFGAFLLSLGRAGPKALSEGLGGDPEQALGVFREVALVGEAYR